MSKTESTNDRKDILLRIISALLVLGLLVSLIPIIVASFYSHPARDDYWFPYLVHEALENGGSFFDVISAAGQTVADIYNRWQGTFAAVFIFALEPGVFSQDLYFITTLLNLFFIVFSTFFFVYTVLVKWLKCKKDYYVITASLITFLQIQFIPDIQQGIFWFNGSCYYSFFYSFSLVFFSLIIRLLLSEKKSNIVLNSVFLALLAIIIGGGNYTTSFVTLIITLLLTIYLYCTKNKYKLIVLVITLLLVAAFMISALAPGNKVRADASNGQSPVMAIIKSLYYAIAYLVNWTRLPQIIVFIVSSPIVFLASKKSNLKFRYPVIALVLFFLIFAAQFTPSLYSLSNVGAGRQVNIYYYAYYWLIYAQMFYLFGWINKKDFKILNKESIQKISIKYISAFLLLSFVIFGIGCVGQIKQMSSVKSLYSVVSGSSKRFDEEYDKILEELEKPGDICYLDDSKLKSDIYLDLSLGNEKEEYWIEKKLARFYHHDKVVKIDSTE